MMRAVVGPSRLATSLPAYSEVGCASRCTTAPALPAKRAPVNPLEKRGNVWNEKEGSTLWSNRGLWEGDSGGARGRQGLYGLRRGESRLRHASCLPERGVTSDVALLALYTVSTRTPSGLSLRRSKSADAMTCVPDA